MKELVLRKEDVIGEETSEFLIRDIIGVSIVNKDVTSVYRTVGEVEVYIARFKKGTSSKDYKNRALLAACKTMENHMKSLIDEESGTLKHTLYVTFYEYKGEWHLMVRGTFEISYDNYGLISENNILNDSLDYTDIDLFLVDTEDEFIPYETEENYAIRMCEDIENGKLRVIFEYKDE